MAEPYVGEIIMFAGSFVPVGWQACDGSLLAISQYDTLFNLIGTTYGGDGQSTFAVPDFRGRVPIHQGQGTGLSSYVIGQNGGVENVTVTSLQAPQHSHALQAAGVPGDSSTATASAFLSSMGPSGNDNVNVFAAYAAAAQVALAGTSISAAAGGGQPHNNIQPTLAVRFIISLYGIYPSQG